MDVLCTDKTGTLTEGILRWKRPVIGKEIEVLEHFCLVI